MQTTLFEQQMLNLVKLKVLKADIPVVKAEANGINKLATSIRYHQL